MIPTSRLLSFPVKTYFLLCLLDSRKRRGWSAGLLLLMSLFFSGGCWAIPGPCEGEQESARTTLQRIEREWPLRGSGDSVTQYVQKLGVRLAHFSVYGRNTPWRFSVVRNIAPNAFSIGGGHVFVTDGAVNFAQNESELAAILAHEMGHELAGHFCGASDLSDSSGLFDIFSAPKIEERQVGIGSLTLAIDPVKEQQADQIAISILQAGGYDPLAILDVARRLPSGNKSHFNDATRIKALGLTVANMPPKLAGSSEEFLKIKRILSSE